MPRFATISDRALIGLIFIAALVLRVVELIVVPHSGYPDADWYVSVARQLAAGQGLTVPYIWNWVDVGSVIPAIGTLPIPAGAHWTPGAAFLALPGVLAGDTPFLRGLPFAVVAAGLPVLGFLVGRTLFARRRDALLVAFAVALPGPVTWFLDVPDNVGLFSLLAGMSLYAVGRLAAATAEERRGRWRLLAGLALGAATWCRPDAFLIAGTIGLLLIWRRRITWRDVAAIALVTGLVVSPWIVRQLLVFGSISPSSATGRILWIRDYGELFSAAGPLTAGHLLSWPGLALSRFLGAIEVTKLASLYLGWMVAAPVVLIGVVSLVRRFPMARVFGLAFLVHAAWSAIVATPHIETGNYLHGSVVYLPLAAAGLVEGGRILARWLTRICPPTSPGLYLAPRVVMPTLLAWVIVCTAFTAYSHLGSDAATTLAEREAVVAALADLPAGAVVISTEPGMIWLETGHPGVPTPSDGPAMVRAAIRAYGVRAWLVTDVDLPRAAALIDPATRPAWVGLPREIRGRDGVVFATLLPIIDIPPP